jgi:hypothetical protein
MFADQLSRRILGLRIRGMQYPIYWAIRQGLHHVSFRIAATRYTVATTASDLRRNLAIAWQLIKGTGKTAVAALATAALFQLFDIPAYLPSWIRNPTTYDYYLQATAAIAGVLLALSFAAISTLASALFTKIASDLRSLLLYEEVTRFSIQTLAFITVLSLTALGLRSIGLPQSRLTTLVLLLALPFAIVSMGLVALRVFDLFDPSILSRTLFRQLFRSARATESGQHRADDPSFQEHHHRQASNALDTLGTMLAFAQREEQLRGESLLTLASHIANAIPRYLKTKRLIPTTSRWFAQRPRYPEWYRASSTTLDMATMTESSLTPRLDVDHYWIERRLLGLTHSAYDTMITDPTSGRPQRLLLNVRTTLETIGAEWDLALAKEVVDTLVTGTTARLANERDTADAESASLEGIADALTGLPAMAFLGFANSATDLDIPNLASRITAMHWQTEAGIRALQPRLSLQRVLERTRRTVLFEREAEGYPVTPGHIHTKAALQDVAEQLRAGLAFTIHWFSTSAPSTARAFTAVNPRLGAIACINALSLRWKIERNLERLKPISEKLSDLIGDQQTQPWPWEEWHTALGESRTVLQLELSSTLAGLATTKREPERPDLLGEAVHRIGEGCFDALTGNRVASFVELFPHYFAGVLLVVNQLQHQKESEEELGYRIEDAMLDLINLSGYARLFSALHGSRQYWTACQQVWDTYLREPNTPERCEDLVLIANARLRITSRSSLRMRWRMTVARILRELPQEQRRSPGSIIPDTFPRHLSRLIRFLGRNGAEHPHDGAAIFRDVYLRREAACAGAPFRRDNFVTAFRRFARSRYE